MILIAVALVLTGLMVWGLLTSRKGRGIDRRHCAAFVGFCAAVIAVTGTTLNAVEAGIRGHAGPYTMSPILQVFNFVNGVIVLTSIAVTFFAGLFSRGIHRIALVSCTVVVSLMLLLTIAAHFGD